MVAAVEDSCPSGTREKEEVTPTRQSGEKGSGDGQTTQGTDATGGEGRRRTRRRR